MKTFEQNCRTFSSGFIKYKSSCKICGIEGPTECTQIINCLNLSMKAEQEMKRQKALDDLSLFGRAHTTTNEFDEMTNKKYKPRFPFRKRKSL